MPCASLIISSLESGIRISLIAIESPACVDALKPRVFKLSKKATVFLFPANKYISLTSLLRRPLSIRASTYPISGGIIEFTITLPTDVSFYHSPLYLTFIMAFTSTALPSYANSTSLKDPKVLPSPLQPSFFLVK